MPLTLDEANRKMQSDLLAFNRTEAGSEEVAESMGPFMTYCIEQFGPERCMFESNFPPEKADMNSGHNVRSTVFVEARAMYRSEGPEDMRPVGEVEFPRVWPLPALAVCTPPAGLRQPSPVTPT